MPFYLGKGSGVVFTSETRPGTVLTLFADEYSIEIEDDTIHISNIKPLRDNNVEGDIVNGDLSAVPSWKNYGIPMQMLNGGMRETTISIHGFLFLDDTISINDGPRVPIINEKGKLEIKYSGQNNNKKTLFKMDNAVVISTSFDNSTAGLLEYDIEFSSLTTDIDYAPHPKV